MKTLVKKGTNVSLYLLSDDTHVVVKENRIDLGSPVECIIGDCCSADTSLFENVSAPEEWEISKYLYTQENGWQLNPDFPSEPESEPS